MTKNHSYFIRANGLFNLYQNVIQNKNYPHTSPESIPLSALKNPMNLLPVSEVFKLYRELELQTQDPDFMLKAVTTFKVGQLDPIGRWMFSSHDLMSTIRKVNFGMANIQSGSTWIASPTGSITKWCYKNRYNSGELTVHDSIRVAVFMNSILKMYLGNKFTPMRIMFSGSRNSALYQEYFNCDIEWNHHQTEIWFHSNVRTILKQHSQDNKQNLSLTFDDLDNFLNMPQPDDDTKIAYELINYSCHFGLPTLSKVAELLGISTQQLQRRFFKYGHNFSEICGFVLSNKAVKLLTDSISIEDTAVLLGYSNVASFNQMFKKYRGITAVQFVKSLN
ncbi:AraC family transcriptional regulator [Vibrio sp. SS-MA-C1-2]|uniref:AraC family transcriptional regulator n=1 Tax=Vibrio sp. SS-MA-C1-2 TaxID=2908646 RepID=UPI001F379F50|nr:AraC family transcriptional regulator [Vibrio sp. SS-MA-C1-2]UJF17743.1 AraC family transcriptional regulator [Vibrio sp. SS-MA-C1-2]